MEKQETRSIRMAMEDMDMKEEKRIHDGAQDEAAELVWKHRNPEAPSANVSPIFDLCLSKLWHLSFTTHSTHRVYELHIVMKYPLPNAETIASLHPMSTSVI